MMSISNSMSKFKLERANKHKKSQKQFDSISVNKDALKFNDRVCLSDRVYKRCPDTTNGAIDNWDDSIDSNHAPLYS